MKHKQRQKKGITPIIAIVILLLITIAIAGVAYTFITGVVTNTAGKTVQVTGVSCSAAGSIVIYFQNVGTDAVSVPDANNGDVQVKNGVCVTGTCASSLPGTAVTFAGDVSDSVAGGSSASVTVPCDITGAGPSTCKYDFLVAGRPAPVQTQCNAP